MRLDKLRIQNYRCFGEFEIDFDPHLTILIASNGGGKTTILDAARVALWPFVKGFDLGSQTGKSATIQNEDVRLAQFSGGNMESQTPSAIEAWGEWSDSAGQDNWLQQRVSLKKSTNTIGDAGSKALTAYGKLLQEQVRNDAHVILPMVTYLGTSRLWYEGRFTSAAAQTTLDKSEYSRTSGYLNCLSYSSSFKTFTAWYSWIYLSYREAQLIALERKEKISDAGRRFEQIIAAIKDAIDRLIKVPTGWHSLEYSASHQQQLVMHHPEQGVLPVDMLSDGLRNTIAMVADLAFRACKLNPHLEARAPLETPGVALIDEVDMFLHPYWQQSIIGSLRAAFPAMQFIVTTHSPQVLSTVRRENIRVIGKDAQGLLIASQPLAMTYGEPSNSVLHSVMQVDPQPPVDEKPDLLQLTEWVDKGRYDEQRTIDLMQQLTHSLGEQHPQLQRLQRSIKRQEALKG
ncbi:DNA replication and repair protein RecF [Pseudomonas fluorescens]|uniref:AAA family ATPase n=1 Tax=Pseudomonas fluorescens TaxID=294 RepID=UPI001257AD2E|nr:AAA family ATPase [Pseudomonas fluorescens]VVP74896.1 DNA replication and repair protein RecF [Pseudomonas fluorescens]